MIVNQVDVRAKQVAAARAAWAADHAARVKLTELRDYVQGDDLEPAQIRRALDAIINDLRGARHV